MFTIIPLPLAKPCTSYTILRITGAEEIRQHLSDLGFVPGGQIKVVAELAGNLIVNVKDSRVGISRELAMKIMV